MRLFPILATSLCLAAAAPAVHAAESVPGPIPARVVEVVDGDTLAVRAQVWLGQEVTTRVRIDGIDTPEKRSACREEKELAADAHKRLQQLVRRSDDAVRLVDVTDDKFGGRVRAKVLLRDGTDVSKALVASGHARPYRGGRRQPWCPVTKRG